MIKTLMEKKIWYYSLIILSFLKLTTRLHRALKNGAMKSYTTHTGHNAFLALVMLTFFILMQKKKILM